MWKDRLLGSHRASIGLRYGEKEFVAFLSQHSSIQIEGFNKEKRTLNWRWRYKKKVTCLPQNPNWAQPCPVGWGTLFTASPTSSPDNCPLPQPWKAHVGLKRHLPNSSPLLQGHFKPSKRGRTIIFGESSANRHLREHGGAHSQCFDKKSGKTALRPGFSTNGSSQLDRACVWLDAQKGGHSFHSGQINTDEWRWAANVFKRCNLHYWDEKTKVVQKHPDKSHPDDQYWSPAKWSQLVIYESQFWVFHRWPSHFN